MTTEENDSVDYRANRSIRSKVEHWYNDVNNRVMKFFRNAKLWDAHNNDRVVACRLHITLHTRTTAEGTWLKLMTENRYVSSTKTHNRTRKTYVYITWILFRYASCYKKLGFLLQRDLSRSSIERQIFHRENHETRISRFPPIVLRACSDETM